MKKSNAAVIAAVAVIAVAMAAIVGVMVFKSREPAGGLGIEDSETTSVFETIVDEIMETTGLGDEETSTALPEETSAGETTTALETTTASADETTVAGETTTAAETTTQGAAEAPNQLEETQRAVAGSGVAVPSNNADLPQDMSFAGLKKQGYDVIGGKAYIYNNDKNEKSVQRKFGYNRLYDRMAGAVDFTIETVRMQFTYAGKDWMVQCWKGQYISGDIGTVGGEVGIYTRKAGTVSAIGQYDCASEPDWLYLECTCFWDEHKDGNYLPQYTRNYNKYWWATGYVDGQLTPKTDNNALRMLVHMTFKDETQANLFVNALKSNGFVYTANFNPTASDTYKNYGKDVIFLWHRVR